MAKAYNAAVDPFADGWDNGGFDTIADKGCAKNIMTIGAANDAVSGGVRSPAAGTMSTFSGWGPTDDGRIKPDLVANGVNLYSPVSTSNSAYNGTYSGTSMATPNAAGSAILLQQLYSDTFPGKVMRASTLKALLIHTADDVGNPGPDYAYGWGYMNVKAAADFIRNPTTKTIVEGRLYPGKPSDTYTVTWNGTTPFRATICWTDPAGAAKTTLDDRTKVLVNDLDLRAIKSATTYSPYVLNVNIPASNATTADNTTDNVEQVYIASPSAGTYTVTVTHKGVLSGGEQKYALILSDGIANLTPYQVAGWSDKIVVSTVTGTNTDSATLLSTNNLYVDWGVLNNGLSPAAAGWTHELYVDGVLTITIPGGFLLNPNVYESRTDYSIGSLAPGTHTIRIKADATGVIPEGNETDNEYTKTILVSAANNNFANAQTLPGSSGTVTGGNAGSTKEPGEPNHAGNVGGRSIWYQWTAPVSGTATIDTLGSNFDTLLAVYTGGAVGSLTPIASNDQYGGTSQSRVTFSAVGGTVYRIAVDGYYAATGNVTLNYSLIPFAPVISSAATARVTIGQPSSYQIVASNSPTSYGATGLPVGLSVNTSTGLISGIPSVIATSNVTLSATNAGGTGTANLALTVSPPTFLGFALDTDPGWTRSGEWAFGTPTGAGGTANGNPDPAAGATGTKVFGVNLIGDYSTAVAGPHYLTAGPFNFTGRTSSTLRFQRWLNTDFQSFVFATLEVSTNGTTWTSVWNNGFSAIADSAWNQVQYDIAALADNQPVVYVRWGYQVASGAFAYSGWNIDDVEFLGVTTAPVITSAGTAGGTTGQPFSYQIVASNIPTSYGATGLPAGLSVSAGGLISGTPTAAGISTVNLSATNAGGTGTKVLTLTVNPPAPVISSAATASGLTGQAFSYQIVASNSPTSYAATGLPAGLSVNTGSGLISGTPTTVAISTIHLSATNAGGTGTLELTLTVTLSPPVITSAATANGVPAQAFIYQIMASNGPTSYGATGLPAGLSVNTSSGLISGTPTTLGTSNVTLSATNGSGTGTKSLVLIVAPPVFSGFPLDTDPGWTRSGEWAFGTPTGAGGTALGNPDPTTGATGTKVFGVNLSGDYSLAVAGPHYLTAGPFDFNGRTSSKLRFKRWLNTDYQNFVFATLEVSTNGTTWTPVWNNGLNAITDSTWTQVQYDIAAQADNQPVVYVRWGYQVAGSAFAYSGWNIDDVELLAIPPAPVISSTGTASGTTGQPFSYQIAASNGPTSFGATGLPAGLSINPGSGLISGTPAAPGISNVTLSATNLGGTGTANLVLTVAPPVFSGFPLDTDPGWTRSGEWAFGTPTGAGGTALGNPDPTTGATGTKVFGVNLSGDYSLAVAGPHYLTAGPFDFSGRTSSKLRFLRWLNTDYQNFVFATLEVSTNGTTWTPVWNNGFNAITDSTWTQVQYDIAAQADNQPVVYVRWGYQVAGSAFAYSGWNIDDVELLGTPPAPVISSADTATGTTGQPFTYQIVASNSPVGYNATGLPAGLTVDTLSGLISGTPTAEGISTIALSATNAGGTGTKTLTLSVYSVPVITSALAASGTSGQTFSYQIVASNSPTSYDATGLPSGLSVNPASGLISGTPATPGISNVTLSATNAGGPGTATLVLTVNPPTILGFLLNTDPAWTREGEWAFGTPTGGGGDDGFGQPDSTAGATGTNVFGVNLSGDYSTAVSAPQYLTAGPFDFSSTTHAMLRFQRWLNTDYQPYVSATIEVSTDGTNWTSIWNNGNQEIADSAWAPVQYDIAALADNQATVYVRWGYQVSDGAFAYSGWNLDDVEFLGVITPPVISSPGTASVTIGQPFSYQITATNNPSGYDATGLPPGLNVNTGSGLISGTPTAIGTSNVTLSATNGGGTGTANLVLTVNPLTLASFHFDTDPNWTRSGEWAFGAPTGAGGTQHGGPDASAGATGTNVFGVSLGGDYSTAVSSPHYLTAGPFDFSGRTSSSLRFQRWLNTDYQPYVSATIEVSTDGTTWTSIWNNGSGEEIVDSAWTRLQYDIAALVDNQPVVYVRWGYQISDGAWAYSGWNIDDVEFLGVTGPPVISSAATASGATGLAFSYQIVASNSPTGYNATGLPAGLSVNTETGLISGTPTAAGTSIINLSATNAGGTDTKVLTLTVSDIVLNTNDSGPGSLRQVIAGTTAGSSVNFAPYLNGATILLTSGQLLLDKNVTINASTLAGGIAVSGNDVSRVFEIASGTTVTMNRLAVTHGSSSLGSGIYNSGTLLLGNCSLLNNSSSGRAAAIFNNSGATLTINDSTISGNTSADIGGGISNEGSLTISNSTFSGNTSNGTGGQGLGGAIFNFAVPLTLNHCTLSSNTAASFGGGIRNQSGTVTLNNTIIAGNTAPTDGPDIADFGGGSLVISGANLIGSNATVTTQFPAGPLVGTTASPRNALLAALANYGGPTLTRALLPGSPARNAAVGSIRTSDQRGFSIVGTSDIGAYEAGTTNNFALWAIENAGSAVTFGADTDGDRAFNGIEYATRRNPLTSDSALAPSLTGPIGGHSFTFRYRAGAQDLRYIVQRSTDLGTVADWVEIYRYDSSTNLVTENFGVTGDENPTTEVITLNDPATGPKNFWRLRVELVP